MTQQYTENEYREFDRLTAMVSSRNQMDRISGRLALKKFVDTHGKEKCDAMWAEVRKRDGHYDR